MENIKISNEVKKQMIDDIKEFFYDKREEEISDFFAEMLLEFMLESIGPMIYNQGIKDSYAFMSNKIDDLFELEKKPRF